MDSQPGLVTIWADKEGKKEIATFTMPSSVMFEDEVLNEEMEDEDNLLMDPADLEPLLTAALEEYQDVVFERMSDDMFRIYKTGADVPPALKTIEPEEE